MSRVRLRLVSKHHDSLQLSLSAAASERACRSAISELGWRILEDEGLRIVTKEVTPQSINFTWAAKIEVLIEGNDTESRVQLNGSITGMGPVQKGHIRGQVGALKNKIGLVAQDRPGRTEPRVDVGAELERLGDLHEKGLLSVEEFAQAKARVLNHD